MAQQRDYGQALAYLYSFANYEKKLPAAYSTEFYDLERVHRLLALLGNPQRTLQIVHVAGTKGKGSTAAMIESVLRAAGYRTGLFTSPHLHTFRERIQAGGDLISEADVARLVENLAPVVAQVDGLTTFEIEVGLALTWFAELGVEWAVLEVGLGGRLDATNVVTPAVSVITSISLDHVHVLGNTLTQIAGEKAGIVKPGVPAVSAPQVDEALAVIEETCRRQGAPLTLVGREWTWQAGAADLDGQGFTVHHGSETVDELWIPLLGEHQLVNATTALAALSLLGGAAAEISPAAIREGLRTVYWPARLEVLGRAPLLVADCAHNGDSARKLMAALRRLGSFRRLVIVLGASADHVTDEFLQTFLCGADRAIATRSQHPRAADPAWLQARAQTLGVRLEVSENVAQALDLAMADADPEDLVCCTGSLYVAAEARAAWFARQGKAIPPSDPL